MTSSGGGDWVAVPIAGEADRWDWVPGEQPASPDGSAGTWHVVGGSGPQAGKWEWFPSRSATWAPPPASAPAPALSEQATEPVSKTPPMPWETAVAVPWESLAPGPTETPAPGPTETPAPGPWQPGPPPVGAAGWHAAPPVAVGKRKRSLKVPLAILGGVVVLAAIATGAILVLAGGGDGKKKDAITELTNYVVTVDSGKDVCKSHLTEDFVQNVFGDIATCERDDQNSTDQSKDATGATVTDFAFDGDAATALVTVQGGDADGTTGTWAFLKGQDDIWRVNEWRADYLRSNFQKAFGDHYNADGADDPFSDTGLRGCVTGKALSLDDAAFLNFAHQQFRGSDEATKQMLTFMGQCPSDTAGVSALRALFEKGFRSSVSTSLTPAITDCIVVGLRTSLSDDDIKELSVNSDQPHPEIEARVQQVTIGCAGGQTTVDATPDLQQNPPGFNL